MNLLSNLANIKTIIYWHKKLTGNPYRYKFIAIKIVELFTFESHRRMIRSDKHNFIELPKPIAGNVPQQPKLSIVIPTFLKTEKDKHDLSNLLESIKEQKSRPAGIFIVDDCSPIQFSFPSHIKVYRLEQNSGPAKARNIGKKLAIESGSDIIAFTDTDCTLSYNWVNTIIQSFNYSNDYQILSGDTPSSDLGCFGKYHDLNGSLNGRKLINSERLLYGTTANLAITKDVACNIDFNENFPIAAGEDIEFCCKANKKGFAIKYIPTMTIYHNFGYTNRFLKNIKLFRQKLNKYSLGEKLLLKEIPEFYDYFELSEEIPVQESLLKDKL